MYQGSFQNRHHGRDAAAGDKSDVQVLMIWPQFGIKMALRRHHFQQITRVKPLVGEGAEYASLHFFHSHPKIIFIRAGADRIRAAHFFPVDHGAQVEVLPLGEPECFAQFCGHFEGDGYRIGGFAPQVADSEWVVFGGHGSGQWQEAVAVAVAGGSGSGSGRSSGQWQEVADIQHKKCITRSRDTLFERMKTVDPLCGLLFHATKAELPTATATVNYGD